MNENCNEIRFSIAEGIARITLAHPEKLNSLSPEMLLALPSLIRRANTEGARVILMTGEGRAFCTGARLGANGAGGSDLGQVVDDYYNPLALALAESPLPLVTALNGGAAGAGVGLALAADIVIAARSAYLLLAFANVGLVPDAGSTWLVARTLGRARTLELALLAERLPAAKAHDYGLIARVVDDSELERESLAVATKLAAMPPLALRLIRRQVRTALDEGFAASLQAERDHQAQAGFSQDHQEGVRAFHEKRPPVFKGI